MEFEGYDVHFLPGDRALEPLLRRRGATLGRKSLPHSSAGTLGFIHTAD
jgi:hypothetical protein